MSELGQEVRLSRDRNPTYTFKDYQVFSERIPADNEKQKNYQRELGKKKKKKKLNILSIISVMFLFEFA